jgi:hypothetical protein
MIFSSTLLAEKILHVHEYFYQKNVMGSHQILGLESNLRLLVWISSGMQAEIGHQN